MNKSNRYFIPIEGSLLLDSYKLFKSKYTRWVYIYLKSKFFSRIKNDPTKPNKIHISKLQDFFGISQRSIYGCLDELIKHGLLYKGDAGKYYVIFEDKLMERCRETMTEKIDTKQSFFQIKYNFFMKYYPTINIQGMDLIFYMKVLNQHYLYPNREYVVVDKEYFTIRRFSKDMNYGHKAIHAALEILTEIGLLLYNQNGEFMTISENKILS